MPETTAAKYRFTGDTTWKDLAWKRGQEVTAADFPANTSLFRDLLNAGVIVPVLADAADGG